MYIVSSLMVHNFSTVLNVSVEGSDIVRGEIVVFVAAVFSSLNRSP